MQLYSSDWSSTAHTQRGNHEQVPGHARHDRRLPSLPDGARGSAGCRAGSVGEPPARAGPRRQGGGQARQPRGVRVSPQGR